MYKVASSDPTVFAVSAWNDNGFAGAPLYRGAFYGGALAAVHCP
jgi:hypothetical protein